LVLKRKYIIPEYILQRCGAWFGHLEQKQNVFLCKTTEKEHEKWGLI